MLCAMGTAIAISTNYEGGRKKERVLWRRDVNYEAKKFLSFFFCFIPHFPPLVKAAAEKVTRVEMANHLVDVRTGARHADGRLGGLWNRHCLEEDKRGSWPRWFYSKLNRNKPNKTDGKIYLHGK